MKLARKLIASIEKNEGCKISELNDRQANKYILALTKIVNKKLHGDRNDQNATLFLEEIRKKAI